MICQKMKFFKRFKNLFCNFLKWHHHRVHGRAPQLALEHLQPSTTYFVRVDVRNNDGTVAKSQAVYRFTTLGRVDLEIL